MMITKRIRTSVVRGAVFGALAFSLLSGLTADHTSAAKYVAVNCDSLYASAIYAGNQSVAADRRGDTATSDFWWSIYTSLEASYVRNCMGDAA